MKFYDKAIFIIFEIVNFSMSAIKLQKCVMDNFSNFSALKIRTRVGFQIIKTNDIVYISASNKDSVINLLDNRTIVTTHLLKWYEENLPSKQFFRCHKTFVINCSYIISYTSKGILMTDRNVIPLGIGKINQLEKKMIHNL